MFKDMTRKEFRMMQRIGIHFKAYYQDHVEVGEVFDK
jgi:hypothetical protein